MWFGGLERAVRRHNLVLGYSRASQFPIHCSILSGGTAKVKKKEVRETSGTHLLSPHFIIQNLRLPA